LTSGCWTEARNDGDCRLERRGFESLSFLGPQIWTDHEISAGFVRESSGATPYDDRRK
jgi:hypothetical protein